MIQDIINWTTILTWIVTFFEIVGGIIIFYGSARVAVQVAKSALRRKAPDYTAIRLDFTPKILLALEIFIANDLVRTILTPTLDQAIILAFVVGIRTVVGVSLNRELSSASKKA